MSAGRYDLVIEAGTDFSKVFTWKIDDVPVDLTGYTARAQVRGAPAASGTPLLEMTTEDDHIDLGGALGTITLSLTAEETTALTWASGQWDLELVSGGGIVKRLLEGVATVRGEVTR